MQKPIRRNLICFSVCIPVLFGSIFLIGTLDYRPRLLSFLPQLTNNATACAAASPHLRVYMYDLPPRFNVGLMNPSFPNNTPVTAENVPAWRWNDGLRKQHSVEYWMMASLLYQGDGDGDREAVRVSDPDTADVFFVPFFSSLSFNVHVRNMKDPDTVDEQLQVSLINS